MAEIEAGQTAAPGAGPGWMRAAAIGLLVAVVLWVAASVIDILVRQHALDRAVNVDVSAAAALSTAATSLSEADQLAAATLLGGGSSTSDQARAVRASLDAATSALQRVDVTRLDLRGVVQQAQKQISNYTTAVNSALDAQRLGPSPSGVATLRNTSTDLRQQVLPPLQNKIAGLRAAETEPALQRAAAERWVLLGSALVVLVVLLWVQVRLAARSGRRLNAGLLVATLALVGTTAAVAATLERSSAASGDRGAIALLRETDNASASALEARLAADDEIVWFSENGTGAAGVDAERRFAAELSKIENRGGGAPPPIRVLTAAWRDAHSRLVDTLDNPDPQALGRASILGPGPGSASSFLSLTAALDARVEESRAEAIAALREARAPLNGAVALIVAGAVLLVAGAGFGLRLRMGDYR